MKKMIKLAFSMALMLNAVGYVSASPFSAESCENGDCSKQTQELLKNARYGSPDAQLLVGWMYLTGNYLDKDLEKAFYWYRKASKQHPLIPAALHQVGLMYLRGQGTKKNQEKALFFLQKAADLGWVDAEYLLGMSFYAGYYHNPVDYKLARKWLFRAAEQNHAAAAFYASSLLEYGKGGDQDLAQSFVWLNMAAEMGHQGAQAHMKAFNTDHPKIVAEGLESQSKEIETAYHEENIQNEVPLKTTEEQTPGSKGSKNSKNRPSSEDDGGNFVEVRGNSLTPEMINFYVDGIAKQKIYKRAGTGSRIPGRTCKDIIGCKTILNSTEVGDILLGN